MTHVAHSGIVGIRRSATIVDPVGRRTTTAHGSIVDYTSRSRCFETLAETAAKYPTACHQEYNINVSYTSIFNSWLMATGFETSSYSYKNYASTGRIESHFEVARQLQWSTRDGPVIITVKKSGPIKREADNLVCYTILSKLTAKIPRAQIAPEIDSTQKYIQEDQYWEDLYARYVARLENARRKMRGLPEMCVPDIRTYFNLPRVQMDETEQGIPNQGSDKQENTIITMDQAQTLSKHHQGLDSVSHIASSEKPSSFGALTKRWMPLDSASIKTTDAYGTGLATYYLPETLYSSKCAPNLAPFEAYIYGRMMMEIRVVVNANKFCCGKVLVSSKYDSYQAETTQNGIQSGLARNHVILDLATNNEGLLQIPFRYHRPYLRLVKNDQASLGVRPSKYCTVYIQVLSPLQTGPEGPTEIELRAYYRLVSADFTGMSYRVAVQMLAIEDFISPTTSKALKEVLVGAERAFDQLGRSRNQDKPSVVNSTIVVPQPRLNFCGGKGVVSVVPLRMNPHTLTNYSNINCPTDEPQNFYELARIWGVIKSFKWKSSDDQGTALLSMTVDPTSRDYTINRVGECTPLEFACGNFMFWSGTIEIRLDFVSNMFHTGTVQITAEFGRKTSSTNECESSSTYTKNFHLGEQKSVNFKIPYIYDTIMRRTTNSIYNPYERVVTTDAMRTGGLSVAPESHTKLKVKIMNQLRPAQNAPQEINVLVFMRAGKNFCMHGLKANSNIPNKNIIAIDRFPKDGYKVSDDIKPKVRTKREIDIDTTDHMQIPISMRNEWGEYKPECIPFPIVQMDNGEKEDQDPTENFDDGVCALNALTLDCQMDFKDILRRPTLLIWNQDMKRTKNGAFYIPLQPPSRDFCATYDNKVVGPNSIYAPTLGMTSAVAVMDMFRCWRGSQRYTIIVDAKKPVYVSLIPHSGVRLIGDHSPYESSVNDYPICGANFLTEMIVPSVNPVMTIEAPYDTENTWSLTFDEDAQRNYSWRDKGDFNSGHLAIVPTEVGAKVTVWWSAGDDFEISNFYGIPSTYSDGNKYRWNDTHGRVQTQMERVTDLGFRLKDTVTKVTGVSIDRSMIAKAAIASVPVIGTPLVVASTMGELQKHVVDVKENISESLNNVNHLAEVAEISISEVTTLLKNAIDQCSQTFQGLIQSTALLYDFLLDILIAWMEKSWKVVGVAFVRALSKLSIHSGVFEKLVHWGYQLGNYIRDLVVDNTPQVQVDTHSDRTSTYAGILCGIVGTLLGVNLDANRRRNFVGDVATRMTQTSGISYFVQMLRFVQLTFTHIKELIMEGLGYISPEARALQMLSSKSDKLQHFIREAQIITSESNTVLLNAPRYRNRVWKTVLQAYQIQRLIAQVPTNAVSAQLSKLCYEVVKYGNDKFMDLSASPVRYEPFVICIEGPSRIGKSHVTESIVSELLAEIGFANPSTENIYYRIAGEKFWSGYRDQPVIVYDEWLNTNSAERNIDQIVEFMKLKSTSIFIPEMAHLEEKKIRGNPLIVIMLCNKAFPNVGDYAKCPEAVYNRRDILLRAERTPAYEGIDLHNATPEVHAAVQGDDKPHLQFKKYRSASNRRSLTNDCKSYRETILYLRNQFKRYHLRETDMVKKRMERLPCFAETMEHQVNLEDPFTLFYGLNERIVADPDLNQNAWTPFEQMEAMIQATENAIEEQMPGIQEIEFPEEITWDTLTNLPQTQISTLAIAGFLIGGGCLRPILSAGLTTLTRWCMQLEEPPGAIRQCSICFEDVRCCYVCTDSIDADNPHVMCAGCHRGNYEIGNGSCPQCRCPGIIPWVTDEQRNMLTVWQRMATKGCKGAQWLLQKLNNYYALRERDMNTTFLIDFMYHFATMQLFRSTDGIRGYVCGFISSVALKVGTNLIGSVAVQSDWDDEEPSTSTAPPRIKRPLEELEWTLNDEYIASLERERNDGRICLHGYLPGKARSAIYSQEGWVIHDGPSTRRRIIIGLNMCEFCDLTPEEYKQFIEQWATHNTLNLRHLYIDYINEPTEAHALKVPPMYRPQWMVVPPAEPNVTWWNSLTGGYAHYSTYINYIVGIVGVLGTMYGFYRLATAFGNNEELEVQYSGTAISPDIHPRHRRTEVRRAAGEKRYFQSEIDTPTVFTVCERYIVRNMTHFELPRGEKVINMYGCGLFQNICIIPKHYVQEMKRAIANGLSIYAYPQMDPQLKQPLVVSSDTFIEDPNTDVAYIRLPPKFPLYKDLRKFIASARDLEASIPSRGVLVAGPRLGADYIREVDVDINGIVRKQIVLDQNYESFEVRDVLCYSYSQPGVCGSILLRENHTKPILSMHIAGVGNLLDGEGYGVLLTQELLKDLAEPNVPIVQLEDKQYNSLEDAKFILDDNIHLRYLGSVPPSEIPFIPTKSKLVRSAIFKAVDLDVPVEPAILSKNDSRYLYETTPLYEGIKKHGVLTDDFTTDEIRRAQEQLWDGWLSELKPLLAEPKRLTVEQAIVGLDQEYYQGIDLSTSAGYPYMLSEDKGKTKKSDYISVIRDAQQMVVGVESLDSELEVTLKKNESMRRQGIIPQTIYVDTLKDEKRKSEKVRGLGGTRVFCSSPVDNVIAVRQNYMHFIAAFMAQRHKMHHAVGINPTSTEWTRLTNTLLQHSPKAVTIDYTNFGPGFNSGVATAAFELIIRWTKDHVREVDDNELWCLVWECVQSIHICNNTVYQQFSGSPSGSVFTTIINSLVNQMYLLLAWNALLGNKFREEGKISLLEWKRNVSLYVYGDDAIMSVSDLYLEDFNTKTITDYFSRFNIVATDAEKTGNIVPYTPLTAATFLKRGFLPHPQRQGEWLSPLADRSIRAITQWVWKSPNLGTATQVNCNAALLQAHGHGPGYYVKIKNAINRALIEKHLPPVVLQWKEIDELYYTVGLEFITDKLINEL
nr:MAG: RNA-dependent RNA polymerase [brine shrimp iflavirus 1]UNI73844.1 MAG: RNA-dependent RNA polymerase [brine shrimp iflavirus 1]